MTKDEALKLALEALEVANSCVDGYYIPKGKTQLPEVEEAITAIREALAQPEQEPVATLWQHGETGRTRITMPNDITDCDARWFKAADLYTTPPQRKPLPKGEWPKHPSGYVGDVYKGYYKSDLDNYAMQVLAAHGIKE